MSFPENIKLIRGDFKGPRKKRRRRWSGQTSRPTLSQIWGLNNRWATFHKNHRCRTLGSINAKGPVGRYSRTEIEVIVNVKNKMPLAKGTCLRGLFEPFFFAPIQSSERGLLDSQREIKAAKECSTLSENMAMNDVLLVRGRKPVQTFYYLELQNHEIGKIYMDQIRRATTRFKNLRKIWSGCSAVIFIP